MALPAGQATFLGGRSSGSIINGDWKLVEFFDDNSFELYNLQTDPGEKNNLDGKSPAVEKQLKMDLKNWRKEMGY